MQHKDSVDIIIIIGPDNPGENTTQKFIQEKLEKQIAHYAKQGLSCKVIGNGKDPVNADDIANLPQAKSVIMCGHGSVHEEAHQIELFKNSPDTNSLIKNIQDQTGAKQFILASCYSGKVNDNFSDSENTINIKEGTEIIALSPPDASTSMYFALDSVLHAVNQIGKSKGENKDNNFSKLYADLLQPSPDAMSYGVQADKEYNRYEFDPRGFVNFDHPKADSFAECRNDGARYFKNFLEDNNRPPLPDEPASNAISLEEYSRKLLNDLIYRSDVDSISKIIKKCPELMSNASINARDFAHSMERMRAWAKDDSKCIGMLKLLVNYDMDHNKAENVRRLFVDMNTNSPPPQGRLLIKCALAELIIEEKDNNKRDYLIKSLKYAEGDKLFDGLDQTRADLLRVKMNNNNSSSAKILSTLGSTKPETPAINKSAGEERNNNVSKAESSVVAANAVEAVKEKQEAKSNNNNNNNESPNNFVMRK